MAWKYGYIDKQEVVDALGLRKACHWTWPQDTIQGNPKHFRAGFWHLRWLRPRVPFGWQKHRQVNDPNSHRCTIGQIFLRASFAATSKVIIQTPPVHNTNSSLTQCKLLVHYPSGAQQFLPWMPFLTQTGILCFQIFSLRFYLFIFNSKKKKT